MTKNKIRDVPKASASGGRPHLWFGFPVRAMPIVLAALVGLAGCGKPPTWSELVNGKQKETPPPAPTVAKATIETPPSALPPKAPEKPKRLPQEVIAEFNATPSERRTDAQLIELASNPEAADQFTVLNLNSSGVSGGMAVLPKFEHVETLLINNCQYGNGALANIAKMKSLTTLSMNGGVLREPNCDTGLAAIKEMHQLTSLSLEGANVTPAGLAHIATMVWLESLNVARTRFNDDNLKILAPLVNLKELNISFTTVSDNGFEYLLPFHELETLKIATVPIRGEGLKELGRLGAFPKLRNLVMFGNAHLELTAYEGVYSFRKSLESLDVGAAVLDDNRFLNAVAPLSKLERLLVHENPALSDAAMKGLPKLRKLKTLYFWKNPGIGDASLPQMAKLKSLENLTIDLTSCSEAGVHQLKKRLKNCNISYNGKKIE